jgi:2'-5' RNA ligase
MSAERLFFALWPNARLRAELESRLPPLTRNEHGRAQRPDQWHVTLVFLGAVSLERKPAVLESADAVTGVPFELEFDRLEHWRRPQVLVLTASTVPAPLAALVADLRAALTGRGFEPETREYRAHVSLARKITRAPSTALPEPIRWTADRYALVRSVTDPSGSRYEPLHWWNLARQEISAPPGG